MAVEPAVGRASHARRRGLLTCPCAPLQASRTGAAAGRAVERAGESVKDEGRGLQAKKQ